MKPVQQEISIEQISQGSLECSQNQSTPCKKAEYQFTDGRKLVVTKKQNTQENQLFVYETSGQIDRRFHPNKQRAAAGIPLRWRGQPFDVAGVVGTSERHAVLIGATLPPQRKASKKFIPRLVLQQYDMATGKAQNLSFAVPVAADWKLEFVRVVNRDKWVMGVQKDAANEQAENAVLIVCQNQHCGGLNGTRLYFDKREIPEDHFLAREQDRLVWMRVGQGESERLQGVSYQLKSVATKGKKVPSYEVIAEPKVTLPQLQSGAFWSATEMMQDRVVYVMQDPSDLAHVRLGCVELADQKPCEGSSGGYFLVGLAEPQEIRNVSISLSGDGELVLRVVGRVVGVGGMRLSRFAVALPATRAQLHLVDHPEETVLWWRNVGPQDKPPLSLVVTASAEALSTLPKELKDTLSKEGEPSQHRITVPASILKAWGETILTRRELDRPVVTADQVRGFYVYGLTLCQGSRCWDLIPGSRSEISAWADMLLQGIPKEDLPRLRQVIQHIRAIAGDLPAGVPVSAERAATTAQYSWADENMEFFDQLQKFYNEFGPAKFYDERKKWHGRRIRGQKAWVLSIKTDTSSAFIVVSVMDPYRDQGEGQLVNFVLGGVPLSMTDKLEVGQSIILDGSVGEIFATAHPISRAVLWINLYDMSFEKNEDIPMDFSFSPAELSTLQISLERHACFGKCPVYKVSVNGKGEISWEGKSHVKIQGNRTAGIPLERVKKLFAFAKAVRFHSLQERFMKTAVVSEGPMVTVTISVAGISKTVVHYTIDSSAPLRLGLLEEKIDEILNTARWMHE